ncbi:TlpA family protein disulfide reductase [Arachidicoccus ginsenosidimutans]|uniref:TlpA family protein disulfide reductase n=1 Tax=Arachidicoccus sp. BS20 TaxID=1850526 RepID=UPI0018D42CBC|nr:TlpA disulfide reductase family protein [Arachidicoccus sp. BS20]
MESELSNQENTDWYNSNFKTYEDSVQYYSYMMKAPQTPSERRNTLSSYQQQLSVFRTHLKSFVQQHATDVLGAKALIITCFRNIDVNLDTLQHFAETLSGQGLHNKYADYFFQEIKGRRNDEVGKMFIPFSMTDINGNIVSSENFKGKNVLVLFWASWCIPCRAEIPGLLSVYHQFKNNNFEVLAVSVDTDKNRWLQAVQHDKTDWHNLFNGKAWNADVVRNYAIHSIPKNVLINPEGKIIAKNISAAGLEKVLSK